MARSLLSQSLFPCMSRSTPDPGDVSLKYIITHVFFPFQLPGRGDHSIHNDLRLAQAISSAAQLYGAHVSQANLSQWNNISRMLENLLAAVQSERLEVFRTISQLSAMDVGDVLAFPVRAQNAGVVFRKQAEDTIYEAFELSPKAQDVLTTEGKLICSYPGPAIVIPNLVFHNEDFCSELANFLFHMNQDGFDALRRKKRSSDLESEDVQHLCYITELLTGILRSVGRPADIPRISKRIGDDVCHSSSGSPWRRSVLWLLIRVTLQTTLDRSPLGPHTYKEFMLFFMCRLATEKGCADLSSDLLHSMSTKISRRLRKLGSSAPDWLSHTALQTCTSLGYIIEDRWQQVQAAQHLSLPWTPSQLDFTQDIQLTLSNSHSYLAKSLASGRVSLADGRFQPKHRRRGDLDDFLSIDGNFFDEAYRYDPHVTLYDVERAVELGVDDWVSRVTNNDKACVKLEVLASKYSSSASQTYRENPELLSVMLLTTIELWVALDKIALKAIPMLGDYSPEIPISILEHLLISKTASLHRLRSAHEYLRHRHITSQFSAFSPTISTDSFAVRYYKTSSHLQRMKVGIETVARFKVRKKFIEMQARNTFCQQRRKLEAITNRNFGSTDMSIRSLRWPLPADQLQAEVIVFELDCPVTFNMWRTATFSFLVDVCSRSFRSHDAPEISLNSYEALKHYLVGHPRSRISLGSDPKRFIMYPAVPIPAQKKQLRIMNELIFFHFDTHTHLPFSEALAHIDIESHCTYKLRTVPYSGLQKYIGSTSHTSNDVIANQADCHAELSIHEYIAFGHLRSGGLLQWLNILRELRARVLTFGRPEVHMLFAQAASQVGPFENMEWPWHQEIKQPAFCHALLCELEGLLRDVETNWMEGVTMDTISFLLRRLLMSGLNESFLQETLNLLRTVRAKVFSWVLELSDKLAKTPEDEWLRGVLRDTAAICRGTYDVDPDMLQSVLQSANDVEIFLFCAIIIHHHILDDDTLSQYSMLLLNRNRRLSLFLETAVGEIIQSDDGSQGIDAAVDRVWADYRAGSPWRPLSGRNSRWFSCTTAPPDNQRSQVVHFNLLDGSLLIDRRPLGHCLPDQFLEHPLYRRIFRNQKLMVQKSNLRSATYSTRELICDHRVYFSLGKKDSDLVIRAKRDSTATDDAEIMELIPQDKLEGDFPSALLEGHVHWLNLSTSVMEIRPLDKLWESSLENWRVDCTPGHYRMWKGHEYLIDIRSQSWNMVSRLLQPLGAPKDFVITVSPDPSRPMPSLQLCVTLPRYDLSFCVDTDGDLQCRNIQGMVYDENQYLGTLFGLVNYIIIRPKTKDVNALGLIPRCVIIPEERVQCNMAGHHVRVKITPEGSVRNRVTYQTYSINTELGCLVGNGSLTSKLYCAYLHALTSGPSADPLTGRSGTEEALAVLKSADCCSNMRFDPRDAGLLDKIASISPLREWNSDRTIQQVTWRALPEKSQSPELYFLSKSIKKRYQSLARLFHEIPSGDPPEKEDDHLSLVRRSARRAAYAHPFGFFRQPAAANVDGEYSGDSVDITSGENRAYTAATCVYSRTATSDKDIWGMVESWNQNVSGDILLSLQYNSSRPGAGMILRSTPGMVRSQIVSGLSLRYDRSWLAPDLPSIFLKAYNLLRQDGEEKWFQMLFSLSAMAYASSKLGDMVPVFVAFASSSQFLLEDPPCYGHYPVQAGCNPSLDTLRRYVIDCAHSFEPRRLVRRKGGERPSDSVRLEVYNQRRNADADATVQELLRAWPCETPPPCSLLNPRLYNVGDLESKIRHHFSACFRNLKLKEHLTRVRTILNNLPSQTSSSDGIDFYSFHPSDSVSPRISWQLDVGQLFTRSPPQFQVVDTLPRNATKVESTSAVDSSPLHQLITTIESRTVSHFQQEYVSALRISAESFTGEMASIAHRVTEPPTAETLLDHYTRCRTSYTKALDLLQRQLGPISQSERAVEQSGQWPRFTAYTLFRCLASNSTVKLSDDWKRCLTTLALLALALQRARRLLLLHFDDLREELCRELENEGCDGWAAETYPDWLLIQLQGNFLIRRVQAEVANEMTMPRSGENTALQLNMGEGKSSVIVPITAAVLANGDQLVRIVVPKPLIAETVQILADRLGGLTNRRIYYLPFSRSLNLKDKEVASFHETMLECMRERGILVVQPDHILSLRLASVEKQLSRTENDRAAHNWLELQKWLYAHSRDILDEIDEILDVRSELVFTIGLQQQVDGSPKRWTTTGQVLALVCKYASSLQEGFRVGVEYEPGPPGAFPYLRILKTDAGEKLVSLIVQDIMDGHLPNVSMRNLRLSPDLDDAIKTFISSQAAPLEKVLLVKEYCGRQSDSLWGDLLLLRGLFATGVLLFAFGEWRWRVNYGLAITRTMLAVPYRAKDVPSQRAEFGHPETAIILTYLSYYYGGLSEEQLRLSFEIMLKQPDPSLTYNLWVRTYTANAVIPGFLRKLSGVNMKSAQQWCDHLYPLFSRNRATIDFYLSNVVFPEEAKEFPSRLSSSGWDLAEKRQRLVTGFSGTNDGRHLLPLHISQRDPDHQRGTNAKVLSYVLQPENKHYMCFVDEDGKRRTTCELLQILVAKKIRVLLDVGAQMLDFQNFELAKAWLDITPDVSAAVYFNVDDELMVCARDGSTQLLRSSPFAQQIDRCLVYLDDAHTRGTNIKFPSGTRAAVTLGPKVTKDRLVQGCMRMRKLGHGHSIMFFAPIEVDQRIRAVAGKKPLDDIGTADILHWVIRETWDNIQRWTPRWVQQGTDHASRHAAWSKFCDGKLTPEELSTEWLQPEARSLEDFYEPRASSDSVSLISRASPDMRRRYIDIGVPLPSSAGLDEEQERELEREERREQQVQRPPKVPPATHFVHPDVVEFVKSGVIHARIHSPEMPNAFIPAWNILHTTSAVTNEAQIWSQTILVTADFERTVEKSGNMDDYLRPVHWIISAKGHDGDVLVVISPHEASYLLAEIRSSSKVHLHLYTPRVTSSMKSCNDLSLYSIPPVPDSWAPPPSALMDRVSVFAGQLYLKDYETYIRLCNFLGVYARDLEAVQGIVTEPDGFILPKNRRSLKDARIELTPAFKNTPLTSLKALMNLRCKGVDCTLTHMGKLLHGRLLSRDDFNH